MLKIKKTIVRLRMWYADIRGHHGKRWDYEPGDWYMGRHNILRGLVPLLLGIRFVGLVIQT